MSGEFQLIAQHLRPLVTAAGAFNLSDDVARLEPATIVTTDTLVLGRHCFGFEPPAFIARKLLRVNLSDIAAKGGYPYGYTLNLALAVADADAWLADFAKGLALEQQRYGFSLLGGDTVACAHDTVLTVTLFARVAETFPQRFQAQAGDALLVTGTLGKAYTGYQLLKAAGRFIDSPATTGYLLPEPRLALGQALRPYLHAAMDVSDGLFGDLPHLLDASGVGAVVEWAALPVASSAAEDALQFGDDYELLVTAPVAAVPRLQAIAREQEVALTRIGTITIEKGLRVHNPDGSVRKTPLKGHQHLL